MIVAIQECNQDSLITWMRCLDTYGGEVMVAGEYASSGDFESALDMLETITSRRALSPAQSDDLAYLIVIYSLLKETPLHSFTSTDRSFLRSIAYRNIGVASGVARALLSSFEEYIPLPHYHGSQIHFRNSVADSSEVTFIISNQLPLKISPNPSDSEISIEWQDSKLIFTYLTIFDFFGQKVMELKGENKSPIQLKTDYWKDGIHWIIAQDTDGISHSGKVLILRN